MDQTINQVTYTLLSASDLKLAKRLNEPVTLFEITKGKPSRTKQDKNILIVECNGEVYELSTKK